MLFEKFWRALSCPITLMSPYYNVLGSDGYYYELFALAEHIEKNGPISPTTRKKLTHIIHDKDLKEEIDKLDASDREEKYNETPHFLKIMPQVQTPYFSYQQALNKSILRTNLLFLAYLFISSLMDEGEKEATLNPLGILLFMVLVTALDYTINQNLPRRFQFFSLDSWKEKEAIELIVPDSKVSWID